jgi:hypothetical protein
MSNVEALTVEDAQLRQLNNVSVVIFINGHPLMSRSAKRKEISFHGEKFRYAVDDGSDVWHVPSDGAVALAKKLLGTIKE